MKINPIYLLSEIPNDDEGRAFIKQLKKYLNKSTWDIKVRGQHLKQGLDWRDYRYGQPIDCSTHLRLYVNKKPKPATAEGSAESVRSHSSYYSNNESYLYRKY
tara:strand:- start:1473 stop:1781 length:309 start_codon:yes stop_codon:yes gene_type:complete